MNTTFLESSPLLNFGKVLPNFFQTITPFITNAKHLDKPKFIPLSSSNTPSICVSGYYANSYTSTTDSKCLILNFLKIL